MRLVWINEHAAPVGGAERYVSETAAGLRRKGVESVLLYAVHGELSASYVASFAGAFPAVDLRAQIREIAPDVVYLNRPISTHTPVELSDAGVPIAAFHHDYDLFCPRRSKYTTIGSHPCAQAVGWGCYPCLGFLQPAPAPKRARLVRPGALLAAQSPWKRFDLHVVGSHHMSAELQRHAFDPSRIAIVPLYAEPNAVGAADGAPARPDRILFVGQLIRGKGLDLALKALARLPSSIHLEVAGSGHQESMFRELARDLGVVSRVSFLGRLDQSALTDAFARAVCVLVPSRYPETFGLIGVEAMAHGVPVVGAAVGAIPEWLVHGVNGLLVPPNDAVALAEAAAQVWESPALRQRMSAAARQRHADNYRLEHHLVGLLPRLQRLVRPSITS